MNTYQRQQSNIGNYQHGFTLIELMVSMVIGLLISGAALQLLLSSQKTLNSQQASSSIQDNVNFGLQTVARSIRAANLGARSDEGATYQVSDSTIFSGLVITTDDDVAFDAVPQNLEGIVMGGSPVPTSLLSCSDGIENVSLSNICSAAGISLASSSGWTGASNLSGVKSDQLVVLYKSPMDSFDCEGARVSQGQHVIERFFLRRDSIALPNEPTPLALACDAGRFQYTQNDLAANSISLQGYGDKGVVLLSRVDHFSFQVGVTIPPRIANGDLAFQPSANNTAFFDLDDYLDMDLSSLGLSERPRISHVRYAVVTRSISPSSDAQKASEQKFNVFNKANLTLSSTTESVPYMREVVTSSVLLRGARG